MLYNVSMDTDTDNEQLTDNLTQPANPVLRKANYKRRKADRRADQTLAAVLASTGLVKPQAIADAINGRAGDRYQITVSQVRQDIATGLAKYKDIAPDDPYEARLLQIARLDMIRTLALDAFIDSQVTVTETVTTDQDGGQRKTTSTKKAAPDAKWASVLVSIEDQRSRLLNAFPPERREDVGQLTVTFAWKEPPTAQAALLSTATQVAIEGSYRLVESAEDDGVLQPSQRPPAHENGSPDV